MYVKIHRAHHAWKWIIQEKFIGANVFASCRHLSEQHSARCVWSCKVEAQGCDQSANPSLGSVWEDAASLPVWSWVTARRGSGSALRGSGAAARLGFMDAKWDLSPQPPGVRNHGLRRGCERETGLPGGEDVGLEAVWGNLQEVFCKYCITVLFELAGFWNGASILACFVEML